MVNRRNKLHHIIFITGFLSIITVSKFFSCVVPAEPPADEFKMKIASGDTISPYSEIKISFSERLKDTSATFQFDPPFYSFYSIVNKSKDTLSIVPSDPLPGDTCFVLHPVNEIKSESGHTIGISDSVVIHVYPTENEPNDNTSTADTLKMKTYGSISTVNDTDFFFIPASAKNIYLKSFSSQTTFKIKDSKEHFSIDIPFQESDTLTIPDSFIAPLFLAVVSYNRSVGGYYETGYITKK